MFIESGFELFSLSPWLIKQSGCGFHNYTKEIIKSLLPALCKVKKYDHKMKNLTNMLILLRYYLKTF